MTYSTFSDIEGIELDAAISQSIIDSGNEYSAQVENIARFIMTYRDTFRAHLQSNNYIQTYNPDIEGFDLAAVDGSSAAPPTGGGTLVVAAGYKCTINDDKQRGNFHRVLLPNNPDIDAFATLLRIHLELKLLAKENLDIDQLIILDQSFYGLMEAISRGLNAYKNQYRQLIASGRDPSKDFMQREWLNLFNECLGSNGSYINMISNKRILALSKTAISQYFVGLLYKLPEFTNNVSADEFVLGSVLNDRALLRHILNEGEYTLPISIYFAEKQHSQARSRTRYATSFPDDEGVPDPFIERERVLDEYGVPKDDSNGGAGSQEIKDKRIFFTYFRPYEWSRVYRVEFHEAMLHNQDKTVNYDGKGERFQKVLNSIKKSLNRETMEPICQVLADLRAKAAVSASTSILTEKTFYQIREKYRGSDDLLNVVDTLLSKERT